MVTYMFHLRTSAYLRKTLKPVVRATRDLRSSAVAMVSIAKVPHESLHVSTPTHWLESRFHFSFADHYDPKRMNFGALRVLNDDLVKPKEGFWTHPHRDAEIFSYVVEGKLSHKDSMGNKEALPRGSIQYLSAGTGITHSEMNDQSETCRFLQIWLTPDKRGHKPQYGSSQYDLDDRRNKLLHVLGGEGKAPNWEKYNRKEVITLHQDANVFVSESDPQTVFNIELGMNRQAYMVCIEGSLKVNDTVLTMRDGARLVATSNKPSPLTITTGDKGAHFIIIEMAKAGQERDF